jgi:NAD(P)-dependent dehydrogenase (short-subunit alcohol dehydrogenase family)
MCVLWDAWCIQAASKLVFPGVIVSKNWFITGASAGFGFEFVRAAAGRGDRVVATSRRAAGLKALVDEFGEAVVPVELDVTDKAASEAAVRDAAATLGTLDVLVNNAGYGLFGRVEELSERECRDQMEVNFFGALWITQAALPIMRAQGSGHIVQISSVGGVGAFPGLGLYHASKWALEAVSESLSQEVTKFGINVTLVEPGPFRTLWGGENAHFATPMAEYVELYGNQREQRAASSGKEPGDPAAVARALLTVVDSERPPLRVLMGAMACDVAPGIYERRLVTWKEWDEIGRNTDFPSNATETAS